MTTPDTISMSFRIDVRTVSEANAHEHWRKRQKRAKQQRKVAWWWGKAYLPDDMTRNLTIRLTRIAPRLLDSDNACGSMKHVRDGIADALGIDDRDPRVIWEYAQAKGKVREYGVDVEVLLNTGG